MADETYEVVYRNVYESQGYESMQKQMQQLQKNFNTSLKNINKNMVANTKSTERYREKVMGLKRNMIAFFFVAREMKALLSPAAQLVGIFDIWNAMLQVTFLPIMLFLMQNVFIPLFNIFTSLSEPIQFIIGLFVTLAGGLGMVATGLNMMGIASTAVFGPWGIAIALIIGAVALIIKYWEPITNFFNNLIDGIAKILTDAYEPFRKPFDDIYNYITGLFGKFDNWFKTTVLDPVVGYINKLITAYNKIAAVTPGLPTIGLLGVDGEEQKTTGMNNKTNTKLISPFEKMLTSSPLMSPAELGFNTGQASPYGQTSGVAGMMNTVFNIKIDTTSNEFDKKMSMFSKDITRSMISMQQNNVK